MHQFLRLRTLVVLLPLALLRRPAAAHAAPGGETHPNTTGEKTMKTTHALCGRMFGLLLMAACGIGVPQTVSAQSCMGFNACFQNTGSIGNNSCNDTEACFQNRGSIGNNSCNNLQACFQLNTGATVGNNSCNGPAACRQASGVIGNCERNTVPVPACPVSDADGDGVNDAEDHCPGSDLRATVVIDGCDSGVRNTGFPSGCTIADLIAACAEGVRNHGQYISCVSDMTNDLKQAGTITDQQKDAIQSCAGQADIP